MNYRKTLPALFVSGFVAAAGSAGVATAQNSSPYVIGSWSLDDQFSDFKPPGSKIKTDNTEFVFLNPTNLVLTLEYAFFGVNSSGITFCGCDRDTLKANGRVRYTMLGEKQGGQFSTQLCPTQTNGTMKSIVFPNTNSGPTSPPGDELQAGYQIDFFDGNGRTVAPLLAVSIFNGTTINAAVSAEITAVHNACVTFLGP
jgi:hypothetical protein